MKTYTEVRQFPSSSTAGKFYTVKKCEDDGKLACDCPAYRFKKHGKERICKHLREVEAGRLVGDYVLVNPEDDREDYRPLAQALRSRQVGTRRDAVRGWSQRTDSNRRPAVYELYILRAVLCRQIRN